MSTKAKRRACFFRPSPSPRKTSNKRSPLDDHERIGGASDEAYAQTHIRRLCGRLLPEHAVHTHEPSNPSTPEVWCKQGYRISKRRPTQHGATQQHPRARRGSANTPQDTGLVYNTTAVAGESTGDTGMG